MTGLNDARLEEVKASARRYLDEMRAHTTCCGVPVVRALLEETIALEVAVAACVDAGTYEALADKLGDCQRSLDIFDPERTSEYWMRHPTTSS